MRLLNFLSIPSTRLLSLAGLPAQLIRNDVKRPKVRIIREIFML